MLDGSGIRAAREAKEMSQTALAEAVGTTQQTINKIECGIMKRTTYLPEIQAALGMSSVGKRIQLRILELQKNPSVVAEEAGLGRSTVRDIIMNDSNPRIDVLRRLTGPLKCTLSYLTGGEEGVAVHSVEIEPAKVIDIALACGADGAKLLRALDVAGFEIVRKGSSVPDNVIDDPIVYIQEVCQRHGLSTTELAREVGLSPSTLNKKVHGGADGSFNANTLQRIKAWEAGWIYTSEIDDPAAYVRLILARHQLSPGALAEKANIAPSTLTRALNDPGHKFKLSVGTLRKIKEWDNATTV